MMFDKRKDLGTVVDAGPPEGGDEDALLHTVAEDLVDAIHARDTHGVMEALKAFLACAQSADEYQDQGEQDQA